MEEKLAAQTIEELEEKYAEVSKRIVTTTMPSLCDFIEKVANGERASVAEIGVLPEAINSLATLYTQFQRYRPNY